MVDNRSAGALGIGGGFNFKSGDVSGTAAKTSDDKQDQGTEYFQQRRGQNQEQNSEPFVDRSAQLRASLNSLAALNAAGIIVKKLEEEDIQKEKKRAKRELSRAENEYKKE